MLEKFSKILNWQEIALCEIYIYISCSSDMYKKTEAKPTINTLIKAAEVYVYMVSQTC